MTNARAPHSAVHGAEMRLLCLPYAGASIQIFRNWCRWLAPRVELVSLELPGRGLLVREPPVERMEALVSSLATAVEPALDKPLALFGHGLGALVAFELSRKLEAAGHPPPTHLFVSAQRAPQLPAFPERIHCLPDAQFVAAVDALRDPPAARSSGFPSLPQEAAVDFLLPVLRADFKLIEDYEYRPGPKLDLPITIFGGVEDRSVTRQELEAWSQLTRQACVLRWLPGNHFFVHEHQRLLAANLLRCLDMPAVPDPSPRALETLGFVTA